MANPQLEAGHTKIANELMEAMAKTNLTAYEGRVLWCILRKTYGWGKKLDRISYTQFEDATGLKRRHIARTIKLLLDRQIITCSGDGLRLEYGMQKDWERWAELHSNREKSLPNGGTKSLPNGGTKDTEESLPRRAESLPRRAESLPNGGTKSLPNGGNTKAIKHNKSITKAITTAPPNFEEYKDLLKINYPDLDVDKEWAKCQVWWSEGKKKMQRPKSALTNWLDRARQIKKDQEGKDARTGTNRGNIQKDETGKRKPGAPLFHDNGTPI